MGFLNDTSIAGVSPTDAIFFRFAVATIDPACLAIASGDPRFLDAQDRIREAERRITQIDDELATLEHDLIDERKVAAALADFDALWECLVPREQARVIELLVERVAYDGQGGNVSITFRPSGIKALASEIAQRKEEAA